MIPGLVWLVSERDLDFRKICKSLEPLHVWEWTKSKEKLPLSERWYFSLNAYTNESAADCWLRLTIKNRKLCKEKTQTLRNIIFVLVSDFVAPESTTNMKMVEKFPFANGRMKNYHKWMEIRLSLDPDI